MPRVIFMAFGTQGDVHPLAAVAAGLAQAKPNCSVFFVTHTAHENLVQVLSASDVSVVFVTSPPIVSVSPSASVADFYPHQLINSTHQHVNNMDGCTGMRCRSTIEDQHRQECLTAIGRILNRERNAGDLIIMNFFALEGWHLAELYKVPCAVAAPYVIPYSAPASFETRFMKSHPLLYDKLKRQSPGKVGWDDVIHWMWPLFTVRWAEWRVKHLNLSSCPLTDPVTELPMIYDWPTKPLVLYGFSKHVVECPSYWPNNVHACGFWFLKASLLHFDSQPTAYPELSAFLDKSKDPPIFIGLSSMGSMGFIDNPSGLLRVLEGVVKTVNQNMILFTSAYAPLETAVITAAKQDQKALSTELIEVNSELNVNKSINENVLQRGLQLFGNKLFCFSGTVPYLWLFPKCCLVIHHGGSGTTAAALHSGVPQSAWHGLGFLHHL